MVYNRNFCCSSDIQSYVDGLIYKEQLDEVINGMIELGK